MGECLKDFPNEKAVEQYAQETKRKVIIFEGTVYDIGSYMDLHPGGKDLLENLIGKTIDEAFEENQHSSSARKHFRDFETVGYLMGCEDDTKNQKVNIKGVDGFELKSKLQIDLSKPLYQQMLNANLQWDEYIQFINEPKHLINPIRDVILFENPFFEIFTKTPWWLIPLAYGPMAWYFLNTSDITQPITLVYFIIGILIWTLGEYLLHRFLFHSEDYWLPNHPKVLANHFMLHGIHHAFPMDRYRLVFPPLPGYIIIYVVFILPLRAIFPAEYSGAVIAGNVTMYVCYDMIHYFMHHSSPTNSYWKDLKKYHMQHHYRNGLIGFGVSSKLWDHVFNTLIVY